MEKKEFCCCNGNQFDARLYKQNLAKMLLCLQDTDDEKFILSLPLVGPEMFENHKE